MAEYQGVQTKPITLMKCTANMQSLVIFILILYQNKLGKLGAVCYVGVKNI